MTPLIPGQTIGGKYVLEEPLGLGALGPVWITRHATLDTEVAIVFLSVDRAAVPETRARFEDTAKSFARVKSSNVVEVHDYGIEGETPFVVVDRIEGETLAVRLAKQQRVSLGAAVPWVIQIGKGLQAIHDAGAVHGELRPENIVFVNDGAGEIAKITVLGLAHALPNMPRKVLLRAEMPFYESPEQARRGEASDLRSDLWSFGVIIFELLTGRVPFPAEDAAEARLLIVADPVPAPSRTNPDLGEEVDRFFERALERDPERRFQSAADMVEAFAALSGAHLAGSGSFTILVKTDADRKTPVTDAAPAPAGEEAKLEAPSKPSEEGPEGPPHEDDAAPPTAKDAPPQKGPWSPVHPTKADPRTGVIIGLVFLVLCVLGVLIVVLAQPPPPPVSATSTPTSAPNPEVEDEEDGPIFVPFVTDKSTPAASSARSAKLGGPWPKASAAASASASPTSSSSAAEAAGADSAPPPVAAPPPRPTSIFGF